MTFDTDEQSIQDSRPVEIYDFEFFTQTMRRTSYMRDFSFGGNTYIAVPVRRSAVAVMSSQDIPEMTVELAMDDDVVAAYAGVGIPPQKCKVTIRRVQQTSGVARQLWSGYVSYCTHKKMTAVLRVASAFDDPLRCELPAVVVSRNCNHVLYDAQCRLTRASFAQAATVNTFSGRDLTLSTVGGNPDGTYDFGELIHTASGERRTIITQVGTLVTLDLVLPNTFDAGDAVTIFQGCDKTVLTCRTKFNNVGNFGGHPHLTPSNFFFIDIRRIDEV